jgi:carboxylate-amine ligase
MRGAPVRLVRGPAGGALTGTDPGLADTDTPTKPSLRRVASVGTSRTLGIEEELHLVDAETFSLAARAPQVLSRLPEDGFSAELQRSTVETNTPVCSTLSDLHGEVTRLRKAASAAAAHHGLGVAACGTAPLATAEDFGLTAKGRYSRMQQDYRLLVNEHLVCGLQVHVGVNDRDLAVRILQRLGPALPIILAMSSSSPYWRGGDSGYASVRTMIWRRWPTAGQVPSVDSAAEYDRLVDTLIGSGVISDAKMAYFDVRPSVHVPTLELRVSDSTPLTDDVALIAGVFRALVERAAQDEVAGAPRPAGYGLVYQAAMWRAARSGLSGYLLDDSDEPTPQPAADVVRGLLKRLRPFIEDAGDWDDVAELAQGLLRRGSSADRQRACYAERGRMTDVVQLVVEETNGRSVTTHQPATHRTSDYRSPTLDEAIDSGGAAVSSYRPVFRILEGFESDELSGRAARAYRASVEAGLTFGVGGHQQVFPVDVVPRVIPAHEWSVLTAGLTQRARAIEAFLRDVYGPAEIVRDGVIPAEVICGCRGWRDEGRRIPDGVVRAPVIGFDLVRDSIGGWRVLEDNVRVPSGVGYALTVRRIMEQVMPELIASSPMHNPDAALDLVGATLRACASGPSRVVALLSDGADNSGWFEHRLLADEAGLLLAQPGEVEFTGGWVTVGRRRVDVVYLRISGDLIDLTDAAGRPVGARLLDAAEEGRIVVVNAPGNGIADDKAMYCYVPDLIDYYLHEHSLLDPVPTYRCADPSEREAVLQRLDELVTKPVGGHGGGGVLIGSEATAAELDERRREITEDPGNWVAQETVALSTLPTFDDGRLQPRHVDLRTFVYLTGPGAGDATLANLALTRMAPPGSMIVNSSRGGGAKDTWLLTEPEDEEGARSVRLDG